MSSPNNTEQTSAIPAEPVDQMLTDLSDNDDLALLEFTERMAQSRKVHPGKAHAIFDKKREVYGPRRPGQSQQDWLNSILETKVTEAVEVPTVEPVMTATDVITAPFKAAAGAGVGVLALPGDVLEFGGEVFDAATGLVVGGKEPGYIKRAMDFVASYRKFLPEGGIPFTIGKALGGVGLGTFAAHHGIRIGLNALSGIKRLAGLAKAAQVMEAGSAAPVMVELQTSLNTLYGAKKSAAITEALSAFLRFEIPQAVAATVSAPGTLSTLLKEADDATLGKHLGTILRFAGEYSPATINKDDGPLERRAKTFLENLGFGAILSGFSLLGQTGKIRVTPKQFRDLLDAAETRPAEVLFKLVDGAFGTMGVSKADLRIAFGNETAETIIKSLGETPTELVPVVKGAFQNIVKATDEAALKQWIDQMVTPEVQKINQAWSSLKFAELGDAEFGKVMTPGEMVVARSMEGTVTPSAAPKIFSVTLEELQRKGWTEDTLREARKVFLRDKTDAKTATVPKGTGAVREAEKATLPDAMQRMSGEEFEAAMRFFKGEPTKKIGLRRDPTDAIAGVGKGPGVPIERTSTDLSSPEIRQNRLSRLMDDESIAYKEPLDEWERLSRATMEADEAAKLTKPGPLKPEMGPGSEVLSPAGIVDEPRMPKRTEELVLGDNPETIIKQAVEPPPPIEAVDQATSLRKKMKKSKTAKETVEPTVEPKKDQATALREKAKKSKEKKDVDDLIGEFADDTYRSDSPVYNLYRTLKDPDPDMVKEAQKVYKADPTLFERLSGYLMSTPGNMTEAGIRGIANRLVALGEKLGIPKQLLDPTKLAETLGLTRGAIKNRRGGVDPHALMSMIGHGVSGHIGAMLLWDEDDTWYEKAAKVGMGIIAGALVKGSGNKLYKYLRPGTPTPVSQTSKTIDDALARMKSELGGLNEAAKVRLQNNIKVLEKIKESMVVNEKKAMEIVETIKRPITGATPADALSNETFFRTGKISVDTVFDEASMIHVLGSTMNFIRGKTDDMLRMGTMAGDLEAIGGTVPKATQELLEKGGYSVAHYGRAVSLVQDQLMRNIISAAEEVMSGSVEAGAKLVAALHQRSLLHNVTMPMDQVASAVTTRDLARFIFGSSPEDIVRSNGGIERVMGLAELIKASDFQGITKIANLMFKTPDTAELIMSLRYAAMLSNPWTHVTNVVSNTAHLFGYLGETTLDATQGLIRTGPGSTTARQYGAFLEGFKRGLITAPAAVKQAFAIGVTRFSKGNKLLWTDSLVNRAFGLEASDSFGGVVGKLITVPTKGLAAEDAFFKNIIYNAEHSKLSFRKAEEIVQERLMMGKLTQESYEQALTSAYDDILNRRGLMVDPNTAKEISEEAAKVAELYTLQRPLEGRLFNTLTSFHATYAGNLLIPFLRTNVNTLSRATEYTPLLNLLSSRVGRQIFEKSAQGDRARSLMAMSAFTGLVMWTLGERLFASRTSKLTRDTPGQLSAGGFDFPVEFLGPFAGPIETIANLHQKLRSSKYAHVTAGDLGPLMVEYMASFMQTTARPEFLENLGYLIESLNDRRMDSEGYRKMMERMGSEISRPIMEPGFIRFMKAFFKEMDTDKRTNAPAQNVFGEKAAISHRVHQAHKTRNHPLIQEAEKEDTILRGLEEYMQNRHISNGKPLTDPYVIFERNRLVGRRIKRESPQWLKDPEYKLLPSNEKWKWLRKRIKDIEIDELFKVGE